MRLANRVESVGAKVVLTLSDGSAQSKWFVRGEGLVSDSSPVLIFGLGEASAERVTVKYLDGSVKAVEQGLGSDVVDIPHR